MKRRSMLVALSLGALSMATLAGVSASHPNTNCNPTEALHGYDGAGYAGALSYGEGGAAGAAKSSDSCPVVGGDGDAEHGVGGGRFPAGSNWSGCITSPSIPHHSYGVGASYWADDSFGANVLYWAGADGPALVQDPTDPTPCTADGIITNDPTLDPLDCGSGTVGLYAPGAMWTPAGLAENVLGSSACDPFDGLVLVFMISGAYAYPSSGIVVASTPTTGHIWDGGGGGGGGGSAPNYNRAGHGS